MAPQTIRGYYYEKSKCTPPQNTVVIEAPELFIRVFRESKESRGSSKPHPLIS